MKQSIFKSILCVSLLFFYINQFAQTTQPNIIFIIIDDQNDYTETLGGHPQAETPTLNALANLGTSFTGAQCSSPKCAPSRTSFISGKDCEYTSIYNNPNCKPFRNYFKDQQVFTMPEYLKDSGGYYTVGYGKIFHCYNSEPDFDSSNADVCSRSLSWNQYYSYYYPENPDVQDYGFANNQGVTGFIWCQMPDSFETTMTDYLMIDSTINTIQKWQSSPSSFCNKPLFITLGLRKPHDPWYIPEKYFSDYFQEDIYEEPFVLPYNNPTGNFPYNGIVMPPQPDIIWDDYNHLGSVGKFLADYDGAENKILGYLEDIVYPDISDTLTIEEKEEILKESKRANGVMAYLAAVKYIDAQIGRLYDSLLAEPDFLNNTILIIAGDNGFSLGEKRHWYKGTMWETDMRVPLLVVDFRNPVPTICNNTVSLLDLFPTVCEMAEIPLPENEDGTPYLDGESLVKYISNPELKIERPALSSYQTHSAGGEDCYPVYAVRNNQFHYLHYNTNTLGSCNGDDFLESELYEIGIERNVDPNEWNNLNSNADYTIVKEYLSQWLPDGNKYLASTFSLNIQDNECNHLNNDDVNLHVNMFNKTGLDLPSIPSGKYLKWWTNLSADTSNTVDFSFSLASIPSIISGAANEVLVYAALYDIGSPEIEGLTIYHVKVDGNIALYPQAKIKTKKRKATISNIVLPAGTTSVTWDYGNGYTYTGFTPPVYTYASYGTYTVIINASNGVCSTQKRIIITLDAGTHIYTKISPNPVSNQLQLNIESEPGNYRVEVYDMAGKLFDKKEIEMQNKETVVYFNTENYPAGEYVIKIIGKDFSEMKYFIKSK